tara:strand:+ start:552 stop:737 length:186 start_codon:yes stop_codon:yes gene_type:complete
MTEHSSMAEARAAFVRERLEFLAQQRLLLMQQEGVIAESRREIEREIVELNVEELDSATAK